MLRTGKIPGPPPKLSGSHLKRLYDVVTWKNPMQLRFEFLLWTWQMVRDFIWEEFGVRLSEVSVGRLLRKLGLSPQRPLRRAYQQDPEAVGRWLSVECPKIRKRARKVSAETYVLDEASVRSDFPSGAIWAPRGKTPEVRTTGARFPVNMISTISARGKLRFMAIEGRLNGDVFVESLKRLLHGATRPIFVMVDRHPVHRSARVRKFVERTAARVELYFLPSYSPELNPDELVWNHVKRHQVGKGYVGGSDQLRKLVISALRRLQRLPHVVQGFLREPKVRYALE